MARGKFKPTAALFVLLILSMYSIWWLHGETVSSPGETDEITLSLWTFDVNVSSLSCIAGHWKTLGVHTFSHRSDLFIELSYSPRGMRNTGCDDFLIAGSFTIRLRPRNDSAAIRRVLFVVENVSSVSVDNVFPPVTGFLYSKTPDGLFEIRPGRYGNVDPLQTMEASALKSTWGVSVELHPFPQLDIRKRGDEESIEARLLFTVEIEYQVRTGFFKSEKRKLRIEIPVVYNLYGLNNCLNACAP